jgi:DNA-binding response OmpR family regulator
VASNGEGVASWRGGIGNFLQRLGSLRHLFRNGTLTMESGDPGILAVTADLGLYSCILNAACASGWTADWAASVSRALAVCSSKPIRIVVYDSNLPYSDWRVGLRQLASAGSRPRILLASPRVDEDLWRTVVRLRGYDVLLRSAGSEQVRRELRFASLSLGHL